MLPYNEMKNDIKNGYTYMEYEGVWYDWNYHFILEGNNLTFTFFVNDTNSKDGGYWFGSYSMKTNDFLEKINSYKEYTKLANAICKYSDYYI